MKIYIVQINPNSITKKLDKLTETYGEPITTEVVEISSSKSGMFLIEGNKLYKLESTFKPKYNIIKGYKSFDLLVDQTPITKTEIFSQLPTEYISTVRTDLTYSRNKNADLSLVIECSEEPDFSLSEQSVKYVPHNFYFNLKSDNLDLHDPFFQEEFNMFLSHLTNI
jgi:hypothetical protein